MKNRTFSLLSLFALPLFIMKTGIKIVFRFVDFLTSANPKPKQIGPTSAMQANNTHGTGI